MAPRTPCNGCYHHHTRARAEPRASGTNIREQLLPCKHCSIIFDPSTGRVTEYYANAAYCRLAGGASVEAHLAAVAARELPEHASQLDHLLRCGPCGRKRSWKDK